MISAARTWKGDGPTMVSLKQAVFVEGPEGPAQMLLPLEYESCEMREDAVRNDSGVADIRIRASYLGWRTRFTLHVLENVLSVQRAFQLLELAGRTVGVGEWRPQSKEGTGGAFGLFRIAAK
jgi:hypothetical protein